VAALLSIPCAVALQVIVRDVWQATAPGGLLDEPEPGGAPPGGARSGRGSDGGPED
jgi:hypothetical protein